MTSIEPLAAGDAGGAAVSGAVIGATVAVVVAVYNGWATSRRERAARDYERRRASLLELQDAALALRRALRSYGGSLREQLLSVDMGALVSAEAAPAVRDGVDDAEGLVEVRLSRVESAAVRDAVVVWRDAARQHFISTEDVSTAAENAAWEELNAAVSADLER